ncbi:glutamate receptor 1-like isoform X2 [Homarus americanus]|uniref:glutamate receptor 1-like isoform X2 n=1 Tax=Homarus americanus TaxID=6706 RepID=UPI001C48B6BA|nr:glutamate receptor 1-like isoform X2 [Homarus americanus]
MDQLLKFLTVILAAVECRVSLPVLYYKHNHLEVMRCWNEPHTQEIIMTAVNIVKTTPLNDLYVTFQDDSGSCLLRALWESGVRTKIVSSKHWWQNLQQLSYGSTSQHLVIGQHIWILQAILQARQLFEAKELNTEKTRWIWFVTPNDPSDPVFDSGIFTSNVSSVSVLSYNSSSTSGSSLPPNTFMATAREISHLVDGMMVGVLLYGDQRDSSLSPVSSSSDLKRWVSIGGVVFKEDGSWQLQLAATGINGALRLLKPLWPQPIYNFKGHNVNIACLEKAGIFELNNGKDLEGASGFIAELLKVVTKHLNLTVTLVPTQGAGTVNSDGSWNGVVGVIARGEADIGAMDFMPSLKRGEVIDFSVSIGQDPVIILSSAPLILTKPFLLLQIFSTQVWVVIVMTVILGGMFISCLAFAESGIDLVYSDDALMHTASAFKMFVFQSITRLPLGSGGRVTAAFLLLAALCLGSVYTGSITAFLVIPFKSTPINSMEDLLSSDVIPTVRSKTNTITYIVNQEGGALYDVRESVLVLSGKELGTRDFHNKMAQGSHAVIDAFSGAMGRANKYSRRGEKCKYHISRDTVQVNLDALGMRRNSQYLIQVDYILRRLQYFGILQLMKQKHSRVLCEAEFKQSGPKPMAIIQAQGPFFVLSVGLLLAAVLLIGEVLYAQSSFFPGSSPQITGHQRNCF